MVVRLDLESLGPMSVPKSVCEKYRRFDPMYNIRRVIVSLQIETHKAASAIDAVLNY